MKNEGVEKIEYILLIISILVFNLIAFLIPKRMTKHEIYTTSIFAAIYNLFADVYLDLKYDWYGYFEKGVQWSYIPVILGLFPAFSTIFLNYYPFSKQMRYKAYYILGWTLFAVIFEWAAAQSGLLYHNEWKLWHSAFAYPVIYMVLVGNLIFIRKLKG